MVVCAVRGVYGSYRSSEHGGRPAGKGRRAESRERCPDLIWEWTRLTYRTYWWHFFAREAPNGGLAFYAPFAIVAISVLGLLGHLLRVCGAGRCLLAPTRCSAKPC